MRISTCLSGGTGARRAARSSSWRVQPGRGALAPGATGMGPEGERGGPTGAGAGSGAGASGTGASLMR